MSKWEWRWLASEIVKQDRYKVEAQLELVRTEEVSTIS